MKTIALLTTLLTLAIPIAQAAELTEADRIKLVKKLDELLKKSHDTLSKRQATAYNAYNAALRSDTAALDLYLNCVERANFEDQGRSSSDFREWKRNQKDRYSDPGFKCALRHQLNWLVLTIEAARAEDKDYKKLGIKAKTALDNVFNDAEKLKDHNSTVRQSALGSVFAKAYGFGTIKVEDWPSNPLAVSEIYETLILPPLRDEHKSDLIRAAWQQRINYEGKMLEEWASTPKTTKVGMKKDIKIPAYEKFLAETRPKLIWQMELDVYNAGDQAEAATRMLEHISKNIAHNDATKWAEQLTNLINPPKETPKPEETTPSPYLEEKL